MQALPFCRLFGLSGTPTGVRMASLLRNATLCAMSAATGCGTDAVGVEACREVEYARCEAASRCGMLDDVSNCRRFYQDHCLHGVRLEEAPRSVAIRNCVEAIEAAGQCGSREGPSTDPDECGVDELQGTSASRVCDIVTEPERAPACAFLDVEPEDDEDDSDDGEDATDTDPVDAGADGG